MSNRPKVILDADNLRSDIRDRVIRLAKKRGLMVVCVWVNDKITDATLTIVSDKGLADSSDDIILEMAQAGDVILTSDRDLAEMLEDRHCKVVDPKQGRPCHLRIPSKIDRQFTNELVAAFEQMMPIATLE